MSAKRRTKLLLWFHIFRLIAWTVQIPVALLTNLKESLPYLVFLSLAALVEGAFASVMATLAEQEAEGG